MGKESMHHSLGPSKYSAWNVCPWAELISRDTKESIEGTDVHAEIQMALDGIEEADDYRARWAVGWVMDETTITNKEWCAISTETKVRATLGNYGEVFGTVDILWERDGVTHIADFKTFAVDGGEYIPQLAGYAALYARQHGLDPSLKVALHVLCGGSLSVTNALLTFGECYNMTLDILNRHAKATEADAFAGHRCRYCTRCGYCNACIEAAGAIVASNPRELFGPMPLAKKLEFCSMVEKVIEGIKKVAKEEAERNGGVLEGGDVRYELTPSTSYKPKDMASMLDEMNFNKQFTGTKRGKEYTVDVSVPDAYEFVGRCNISRTALADLVASKNPTMTKKDVNEWVTQFYNKIEGEMKLVKVKAK